MKMILLLSLLVALVGCKNPVTGEDISNPLSKEELFANSLDRQDGYHDVEVIDTFVGDDGQTYVALKWKEVESELFKQDEAIEAAEKHYINSKRLQASIINKVF